VTAPTTSHTNTKNPTGTGPDTWTGTVVGTPAEITLTLQCLSFKSMTAGEALRLQVKNGPTTFLFVRNGSVIQI
jgi:hypothetical protein